jgi:hypothetical protein
MKIDKADRMYLVYALLCTAILVLALLCGCAATKACAGQGDVSGLKATIDAQAKAIADLKAQIGSIDNSRRIGDGSWYSSGAGWVAAVVLVPMGINLAHWILARRFETRRRRIEGRLSR